MSQRQDHASAVAMAEHRIRLDLFEGPLDLLLHLIRRDEIEITDIPIAQVADQYLAVLRTAGIERIDIDTAGEFLVMAATLTEIKSRMLNPRPPGEEPIAEPTGNTTDPRAELVQQLLAYKKFRDAAASLEDRRTQWESRYPAARAGTDNQALRDAMLAQAGDVELGDLTLVDLAQAFAQIAASVNFDRLGDHQVTYDDTPIEIHAEDILSRLREPLLADSSRPAMTLQALFAGRKRGEMLGLFLATLELVKRRLVRLSQEAPGAPITIEARPEDPAAASPDVAVTPA